MAVRVQVLDERGLPVFCTVAAVRTSDQSILALYDTDSEGVVNIIQAGTWYPRPMVSLNYKSRIKMVILNAQDSMNADYVVDAGGGGTHLTLHGSTGALAAAIVSGTSKFIWVCASHTESRSAVDTLAALATAQKITIASGGRGRGTITYAYNGNSMGIASSGGDLLRFENIKLVRGSGNTGALIAATGGAALPAIEFSGVDWGDSSSAWTSLLDMSGAGSATPSGFLVEDCVGNVVALAKLSSLAAATGPCRVRENNMGIANAFVRAASTDFEIGNSYEIDENIFRASSYLMQRTYGIPLSIRDNRFVHSGAQDFIDLGTAGSTNVQDVSIGDNNYVASAVGARFVDISPAAGTGTNIAIMGNALRGPGSGTAINVSVALTDSVIQNGYIAWTTNVGGVGAPGSGGDHGMLSGLLDDDHTHYLLASGARALTGNWVQSGAFDIYHAKAMRVGASTAPTNVVAGDFTTERLKISDGGTSFGASSGYYANAQGTLSDVSTGAKIHSLWQPSIAPQTNGSSEFRTFYMQPLLQPASGVAMYQHHAMYIENRNRSNAAIEALNAYVGVGVVIDSSSPATVGTMATVAAFTARPGARPSGTSVARVIAGHGFRLEFTGATGITWDTLRGFYMPDPPASWTITDLFGLDIEKPTRGSGTNVGIRNAGRYVAVPPTATNITAVGTTIPSDAEVIRITANASYTLTTTPSITNGQYDGQRLYIVNEDTVDTITLQDESGLAGSNVRSRTGSNIAIGPREVHEFIWNAANSEWYDVGTDGSSGGGGGHTIQENGTSLTARTNLNFEAGLAAVDTGADTLVRWQPAMAWALGV